MTPGHKHKSWFKAACAVTLLAWLMLLGQTMAHASDAGHANLPSSHCVICSAGHIDDDVDTPTSISDVMAPVDAGTAFLPASVAKTPGIPRKHTAARAPPLL